MKKITLITMIFLCAFAKAQVVVDPETFPIVDPKGKFVYTNTGGEGKFLVDSIVRLAKNGVNGQDSLGLGGNLVQNTEIFLGPYSYVNWSTKPTMFGGTSPLGLGNGHILYGCNKNYFTGAFNNDIFCGNATYVDTCSGDLYSSTYVNKVSSGTIKSLSARYNSLRDNELMFVSSRPTSNIEVDIFIDDINRKPYRSAFRIAPVTTGNPYDGVLFDIIDNSESIVMLVRNNGTINILVPQYNNDVDAGLGGLINGDLYKTTNTNTLGLPAGVLMIKQ